MKKQILSEEFKRMQKLAGINEMQVKSPDKATQIKALIQKEYPEVIDDGTVETGTDEWLSLLQLALKAYGINLENSYDFLFYEKGPYAKQIDRLNYSYVRDLETALENLGVEII
jgi:hypothetical protein